MNRKIGFNNKNFKAKIDPNFLFHSTNELLLNRIVLPLSFWSVQKGI